MNTFYILAWKKAQNSVDEATVVDCFSASTVIEAKRQLKICAKVREGFHHFQLVEQKALALV